MDRFFAANVATTPPTLPGTAVKGYPQDGDVATSKAATIPGAYAFWQLYAELLGVITAAGETPDPSNLTQVAAAVNTIATSVAGPIATAAAAAAQAAAISAAATDATTKANAARAGAVTDVNAEFTGTHQDLTVAAGHQEIPGNQMHVWVEQFQAAAGNTSVTITYPKAFTGTAPIPQVTILDASLVGGSSNFLGYGVVSRTLVGCVVATGLNGGSPRDVTLRVDAWGTA